MDYSLSASAPKATRVYLGAADGTSFTAATNPQAESEWGPFLRGATFRAASTIDEASTAGSEALNDGNAKSGMSVTLSETDYVRYGGPTGLRVGDKATLRIKTGPAGVTLPFMASIPAGRVRFGAVEAAVFADENINAADRAEAAAASAASALASIQIIGQSASEVSYFRRDPDGSLWVTDTPIVSGGGKPRVVNGAVYVDFPI